MVSGRGTRQSSFPRGMRRLSFSVFIRQKKSGGASGSCSGMGVSPGRRESLRLSPFRTQWRTGPRVTQVRQRRTACARAWEASGGGSGALSPSVSINVEKTPSRSMGRWRSRPLTGAMGKSAPPRPAPVRNSWECAAPPDKTRSTVHLYQYPCGKDPFSLMILLEA